MLHVMQILQRGLADSDLIPRALASLHGLVHLREEACYILGNKLMCVV